MRFIGDPEPNSPILRQTLRRIINEIWKWKGLNVVSYTYFDNKAICKQQIKKKSVLDIGMRYVVIIVWKNWRKKRKDDKKNLLWFEGLVLLQEKSYRFYRILKH